VNLFLSLFLLRLNRCRRRAVAARAEGFRAERAVRTVQTIPDVLPRTINRDVRFAVAVIIGGNRRVARKSETADGQTAVRRFENIPVTFGRSENSEISFSVTVEIADERFIGCNTKRSSQHYARRALHNIPNSVAVNSEIGFTIAFIIGGENLIAVQSPLHSSEAKRGL
jgi:hypothetical protein